MTHLDVIRIIQVLQKLYIQDMDWSTAFDVYNMMRELDPVIQFQAQKEQELYDKYKPDNITENGAFFQNGREQDANMFDSELKELRSLKYDKSLRKIHIRSWDNLKISPADVATLKKICEMEGDGQ